MKKFYEIVEEKTGLEFLAFMEVAEIIGKPLPWQWLEDEEKDVKKAEKLIDEIMDRRTI